ncbi:hypothetical protein SDC9_127805 [bioreactor metagenome]|uniref:Uncharacterized protein n=1 Tax=bioreactor metagenome TaxID=1076179 RepID=A0A645CV50_9ZZZZ
MAVTITSSSNSVSGTNLIFTLSLTGTSCVTYPTYETINVPPDGADRVKLPLTSVTVPCAVPFICTEAPMVGSPFSSITVPRTCIWAVTIPIPTKNRVKNKNSFLFMLYFF